MGIADQVIADLEAVRQELEDAAGAQYEAPPVPTNPDDVKTSSAEVSDPTSDVALDARRLRLRAQVAETERGLEQMRILLHYYQRELRRAYEAWAGDIDRRVDQ